MFKEGKKNLEIAKHTKAYIRYKQFYWKSMQNK